MLSYISASAERKAIYQSKMKLLPLEGRQVWTVKANTLIADAYICFDYLRVPKKDQIFGRQGWKIGFVEQEFMFPSRSSSAYVVFAIIPTFFL